MNDLPFTKSISSINVCQIMKLTGLLQEHKEISITSPTCFGQVFAMEYTNCLVFHSPELERKVRKKLSIRFLSQREKWLGFFYAKEILCGCQIQLTIAWINQKAGYGVFANQEIARNACIGEYTGLIRKRSRNAGDSTIH